MTNLPPEPMNAPSDERDAMQRAEIAELRELVALAQPFALAFCRDNPLHSWNEFTQDPFGVHKWIERANRTLSRGNSAPLGVPANLPVVRNQQPY